MITQAHAPLVSILVPVYNREDLVGLCLRSALAQTCTDFEIVVVDNASTDGTLAVCHGLAAQDPRIRVFRNDTNLGPVRNWLRCIAEARGVYGKILFSDDLMAPDYLEKTIPFLEREDVGFVFTSAVVGPEPFQGAIMYQFTGRTGVFDSRRFISMALFNGDLPVSPGGALFRLRDLRDNLLVDIPSPVDRDFSRHGAGPDLLIFLLTAASYTQVAYLHEPLSYFRAHEGSITLTKEKCGLTQCYRHARLWFAERYLPVKWLKRLYVYEWKRECKETRKWTLPAYFVLRYRVDKLAFSPLEMVSGLLAARPLKKGHLILPRNPALDIDREKKR